MYSFLTLTMYYCRDVETLSQTLSNDALRQWFEQDTIYRQSYHLFFKKNKNLNTLL